MSRAKGLALVAAGALAGALGIGIATAAGGGSSTIHGCYSKRTGALRIAKVCKHRERVIVWNKQGPAAANGTNGTNGAPGTARAYAYVHGSVATPTFDSARTFGFRSVSEPHAGVYCLTAPGIEAQNSAPAVTAVYNAGFAGTPTFARLSPNFDCQSGQFEVLTSQLSATYSGPNVTGFSENSAANLDFTIVVP